MFDVNTILIGAAKFIAVIAFIIVSVNFGLSIKKEFESIDPEKATELDIISLMWAKKLKFSVLIGLLLLMIYVFNIEAAFRPKYDVNEHNPPQEMTSSAPQEEVKPDVRTDYKAMLEASREENEAGKKAFKELN